MLNRNSVFTRITESFSSPSSSSAQVERAEVQGNTAESPQTQGNFNFKGIDLNI